MAFWSRSNLHTNAFTHPDTAAERMKIACEASGNGQWLEIGKSEERRPIYGAILGNGPQSVSLIAGSHSDEPVGPETLRTLISHIDILEETNPELFDRFTFLVIPHINPDGEAENWKWIKDWPDLHSFIRHAYRELPGRDLEFGYPEMRVENRVVSSFLRQHAPVDLHMSLHGMAFSEGVMLLIDRHWIDRTKTLRNKFIEFVGQRDLPLHDHDRGGEKGFKYIGPGFTTTPEGRAMKKHFMEQGDPNTAVKFHLSSMEYVRTFGGDPLCLVTELPLFLVHFAGDRPTKRGIPEAYLEWKNKFPLLRAKLDRDESIENVLQPFHIQSLSLLTAINIQLRTIELALQTID
jgi:hypothetical protein